MDTSEPDPSSPETQEFIIASSVSFTPGRGASLFPLLTAAASPINRGGVTQWPKGLRSGGLLPPWHLVSLNSSSRLSIATVYWLRKTHRCQSPQLKPHASLSLWGALGVENPLPSLSIPRLLHLHRELFQIDSSAYLPRKVRHQTTTTAVDDLEYEVQRGQKEPTASSKKS